MSEAQKDIMVADTLEGIINIKINISEIKFMESDSSKSRNRIIVHTTKGDYYTSGSMSQWASFMIGTSQDFIKGDRNVVINISQIADLDCKFNKAIFHNGSEGCFLSEKAFSLISKRLGIVKVRTKESLVW